MKRVRQCLLVFILCLPAIAQQTDINRYTLFTGFDYMVSPARNLTERGFETDFGITARPWLGLGGDFSIITGAGTINGSETVFAPLLIAAEPLGAPPPNTVNVAFTSTTYIFAAGPQFYWRKWKKVTLFARPGFGGIHETADISLPPQLGFFADPAWSAGTELASDGSDVVHRSGWRLRFERLAARRNSFHH